MKKLQNIKHIFFDLDHTLWDFDRNSEMAFAQIFSDKFPHIATLDFIKVYIPINQECWRLYQTNQISHDELRYNRLKHSFDAIDIQVSDDDIDFIAKQYLEILPNNNFLIDGAIELLDGLKSDYKLHIITNGFTNVQYRKLQNSGLSKYFETVTNSERAGVKKPDARIFEVAITDANASVDQSIMIGDSWEADVMGAINANIKTIFYNPEKSMQNTNSELLIADIQHLLELQIYI